MGTRLFELTYDAPRRLEMMHGDAHPGNFMLMPDGKMGVIDFGAVAPLPGGLPVELGQMMRYALDKDYDKLLPTMEKIGFIQKGEQVSVREIDDMLRQYVEPLAGRRVPLHPQVAAEDDRGQHGHGRSRRSRPRGRWTSRPSWRSRCG